MHYEDDIAIKIGSGKACFAGFFQWQLIKVV